MTTSISTKRLTVDMTTEEHRQLKTLAAFHGVTMKEYLLSRALFSEKPTPKAGKSNDTDYLLHSDANKKRLLSAIQKNENKNKKFKSLKELKNALRI